MRLDRLTPAHVRRAVQIFLDLAWPAGYEGVPTMTVTDLEDAKTLEELLLRFERPKANETRAHERYMLRLGNRRYPFMKFVVQEYLVDEEYFFSVDTHDDLKITPDMPDYAGFQAVRAFNRELKERIEHAWHDAGLPTNEDLRELMEALAPFEKEEEKRARLLVVDDEADIARGLKAMLEARGYAVECAFDGAQVLERIEAGPCPDLLLLDYSMPELDGEQVMQHLRNDPRYRDLPILLATATSIDLATMQRATGLLRKPYPREVLCEMIDRLLKARESA